MTEIQQIETWLQGELSPEEQLLFEAKTLTDDRLAAKVGWQRKVYAYVRAFARRRIRKQIQAQEQVVFQDPQYAEFQQKVHQLFQP